MNRTMLLGIIGIMLFILPSLVLSDDLTYKVIGSWNFDQSNGNTTPGFYLDSSGFGFDMTNVTTATTADAIVDTGIYLDGNDYIWAGDVYDITGGSLTICHMAKSTDISANNRYAVAGGTAGSFASRQYASWFVAGDASGPVYDCGNLASNKWYAVCVVYNGTAGFPNLWMWINGTKWTSSNCTTAGVWNGFDDSTNMTIGASRAAGGGPENYWVGSLDEVTIWNRSLTDSEAVGWYINMSAGVGFPFGGEGGGAPPAGPTYNSITLDNNNTYVYGDPFNNSIQTALNGTCKYSTNSGFNFATEGTLLFGNETRHYWNMSVIESTAYSFYYKCNQSNGTITGPTYQVLYGSGGWVNMITCFGDSNTEGTGVSDDETWCYNMFKYLNDTGSYGIVEDNAGRGGSCLADYAGCANPGKLIEEYPGLVANNSHYLVYQAQMNDNFHFDGTYPRYGNNLSTALAYFREYMDNTTFVFGTQLCLPDGGNTAVEMANFNRELRQQAIIYEYPFIEITYLENCSAHYQGDNLHLSVAGHQWFNRTMMAALLNPSDYIMTRDLFSVYHWTSQPITILNYTFKMPTANNSKSSTADWLVILNITPTQFYVRRADKPFHVNITEKFLPLRSYIALYDNGTSFNFTTNATGGASFLNFSAGVSYLVRFIDNASSFARIERGEGELLGFCNVSVFDELVYEATWYLNGENISYSTLGAGNFFIAQETADEWAKAGHWDAAGQPELIMDDNSATYGYCQNGQADCIIEINYTIPENMVNLSSRNVTWNVQLTTFLGGNRSIQIPEQCINDTEEVIMGRLTSKGTNPWGVSAECWNGTGWFSLYYGTTALSIGARAIFNENITFDYDAFLNGSVEYNIVNTSITELGNYTISCRAFNGTAYSSWYNSTPFITGRINLTIYNERNLSYMGIDNISEVRLDVFCDNVTERYDIKSAVSVINTTCFYDYINLWFIYNENLSYYRTLIPDADALDVTAEFFMIDLFEDSAVLWDITIVDLTGEYSQTPVYVTKNTHENGTIEIIRQLSDLQNRVHLYLMKDETYNLNVLSETGYLRAIGEVLASTAAQKIITLPSITFKPDIDLGESIKASIEYDRVYDVLRVAYEDASDLTESVEITIYNSTDMSSLASFNTSSSNFTYTFAISDDVAYILKLEYCHEIFLCHTHEAAHGFNTGDGPDFSWIAPNGSDYSQYKKFIGLVAVVVVALVFPAEYVVVGAATIIIELIVFPAFGLIELDSVSISLFIIMLGITIVRGVLRKR